MLDVVDGLVNRRSFRTRCSVGRMGRAQFRWAMGPQLRTCFWQRRSNWAGSKDWRRRGGRRWRGGGDIGLGRRCGGWLRRRLKMTWFARNSGNFVRQGSVHHGSFIVNFRRVFVKVTLWLGRDGGVLLPINWLGRRLGPGRFRRRRRARPRARADAAATHPTAASARTAASGRAGLVRAKRCR